MADGELTAALALLEQLRPAIERGDRAQQVDITRRLIAMRAPMGGQWQQMAYVAAGNGELALAREAIDLLVEASGGGPDALYTKGGLLALLGDWRAADALLRTLPEDVPDPGGNAYSRGTAALNLGKADEARRHLEQATLLLPR